MFRTKLTSEEQLALDESSTTPCPSCKGQSSSTGKPRVFQCYDCGRFFTPLTAFEQLVLDSYGR